MVGYAVKEASDSSEVLAPGILEEEWLRVGVQQTVLAVLHPSICCMGNDGAI